MTKLKEKGGSIMSVSSVSSTTQTYESTAAATAPKTEEKKDTTAEKKDTETAAVYEKSSSTAKSSANKIYNRDSIVAKLKADQQSRADSMQSLVEKLLGKQKGTFDLANSTNLAATFRQAASLADPETIKKAQEDISEDGYWGVNKTSDRLVSMAIALSGGDTEKADEMMAAIKKGYDKATKSWGEDLPDICKKTLEATEKKMDDWKSGKTTAKDYSDYLS